MLAIALLLTSPAAVAKDVAFEARPDVAYGPFPQEVGDLYVPAGRHLKPAVLIIHGGGWIEGSRESWKGFAETLAAQGAVVFNIDYRLAIAGRPDTLWPAQLRDAQLAVRFLRAHADELAIDPKRIGASGDSAGGQLALFLGSLPHPVAGDVADLFPGAPADVQAVVDQFGPIDIPGMYDGGAPASAIMFGTPIPTAAQYRSASPLGSLTAHSAATLIIQGESDVTVPPGQSRALLAALKAKHVPAELVSYPGGHGYSGLSDEQVGALHGQAIHWLLARLER